MPGDFYTATFYRYGTSLYAAPANETDEQSKVDVRVEDSLVISCSLNRTVMSTWKDSEYAELLIYVGSEGIS